MVSFQLQIEGFVLLNALKYLRTAFDVIAVYGVYGRLTMAY
jgi:hypothetical protein